MLIVLDKEKLNTTRWELMKFNIKGQSEENVFLEGCLRIITSTNLECTRKNREQQRLRSTIKWDKINKYETFITRTAKMTLFS